MELLQTIHIINVILISDAFFPLCNLSLLLDLQLPNLDIYSILFIGVLFLHLVKCIYKTALDLRLYVLNFLLLEKHN